MQTDHLSPEVYPLIMEEFSALIQTFLPLPPQIAVAVSGGIDSLALMLLLHEWASKHKTEVIAITFDHTLRPESKEEAEWVHRFCQRKAIKHFILINQDPKPSASIQEWARLKRYEALELFCYEQKINYLFLAHHMDDQAETFLMRLLKKSHWRGLSAMLPLSKGKIITLCRPLLTIPKKRLERTLEWFKVDKWIEDPSNLNKRFLRGQFRQELMPQLEMIGLTHEHLAQTANDIGKIRLTLEDKIKEYLTSHVSYFNEGYASVNLTFFTKDTNEIVTASLQTLLQKIGGTAYPTSSEKVNKAIEKLLIHQKPVTIGRCLIQHKKEKIYIFRENRHLPEPVKLSGKKSLFWDNRFLIQYKLHDENSVILKAVGEEASQINKSMHKKIPFFILKTLPSFQTLDGLTLIPHLSYGREKIKIQVHFLPLVD